MEFILDETEDDTPRPQFSHEDEEETLDDLSSFVDNTSIPQEGVSFY